LAKLILTLNGSVINQYFIDKACVSIGRGADNDIVINDPVLSREHARVVSVGKDQIVEDLQSSNGTLVNGTPLVRQILQHCDVIELGSHQLRYMSARVAADVELERTMMIQALARNGAPAEGSPVVTVPVVRAARVRLPEGCVKVLAGEGRHAIGETVRLDRVVATFGTPGEQLLVIARRPQGFVLTHVEGAQQTRVNQQSIGSAPHTLCDGDLIEAAGYRLEFRLDQPIGKTDVE
jgi:pSer/pThr/pTyr-binding forkhead associated (FHA) protein